MSRSLKHFERNPKLLLDTLWTGDGLYQVIRVSGRKVLMVRPVAVGTEHSELSVKELLSPWCRLTYLGPSKRYRHIKPGVVMLRKGRDPTERIDFGSLAIRSCWNGFVTYDNIGGGGSEYLNIIQRRYRVATREEARLFREAEHVYSQQHRAAERGNSRNRDNVPEPTAQIPSEDAAAFESLMHDPDPTPAPIPTPSRWEALRATSDQDPQSSSSG